VFVKQTKKLVDRVCDDSNQEGFERKEVLQRNHYFDNELVEHLLCLYHETACTNVKLRDMIMVHADELIRQTIKAHNLSQIYPGKEESSIGDLFQTAWVQIESALYKYDARPHCNKCYNPLRPGDSVLSDEFMMADDILKKIRTCPKCKITLTREFIHYRGKSKVFNMWCVNPNTLVMSENGLCKIGDFNGSSSAKSVYGLSGIRPVISTIWKPKTITTVVKTEYGFEIEGTPQHYLMKLNKDDSDWAQISDLKCNDLVGISYGQHYFNNNDDISDIKLTNTGTWSPPKKITEELAYFFGLYMAEGSYCRQMVHIYNQEPEVIKFLEEGMNGLNFQRHEKNICSYACNIRFSEFLDKMGFDNCHSSHTKVIPPRLLQMSKPNINAFLRGYADGDGHSSRYGGYVGFTSTSEMLLNQVRMLLLNIGILSKLSIDPRTERTFKKKSGKIYTSKLHGSRQLNLSTIDSLRFYDMIGFNVKRKQNKMKYCNIPNEYIYGLNDHFRGLYNDFKGHIHVKYDRIRKLIRPGLHKIRVDVALRCLKKYWSDCDGNPHYRFIADRLDEQLRFRNKIKWLPIIDLRKSESQVCDIEVDSQDHSYIANGFISHNSQISRTVILAYIKKESRDRKNSPMFTTHLENKTVAKSHVLNRFITEAREICKYNPEYIKIIETIEKLYSQDERPHEGLVAKLSEKTGLKRIIISDFLRLLRQRSFEFTDSPVNEEFETIKHRMTGTDKEKEDE
jgi:intein/homing endonuclease